MSSGFQTKRISNKSHQLQGLARKLNFARSKFTYDSFHKVTNKGADQSAPALLANPRRQVFPHQGPNVKRAKIGSKGGL